MNDFQYALLIIIFVNTSKSIKMDFIVAVIMVIAWEILERFIGLSGLG